MKKLGNHSIEHTNHTEEKGKFFISKERARNLREWAYGSLIPYYKKFATGLTEIQGFEKPRQ